VRYHPYGQERWANGVAATAVAALEAELVELTGFAVGEPN